MLARMGYDGPVYGTPATLDMTSLILRDSARIQLADTDRHNRKRQRAGEAPLEPLYTPDDAETLIRLLRPVPYQEPVQVADGIRAVWAESGHMLGSASILLLVEEKGQTRRIVFSGDLGPRSAPMLREYEPFHEADLVFLESTYGARDHRSFTDTVAEFETIIQSAVAAGGKILVPTFAVGRAQLVLLLLGKMFRARKVRPFPIFLDSPMAIEATNIYTKHLDLFDDEMKAFIRARPLREDLKTLKLTASPAESRAINDARGPCLVLAGAGMCNAGRIVHHLRASLWKPGTHVLIVGYQAEHTLGKKLVMREPVVNIFGEPHELKAEVVVLNAFSGHADRNELLAYLTQFDRKRLRKAFLVHGDLDQAETLAAGMKDCGFTDVHIPARGDTAQLT